MSTAAVHHADNAIAAELRTIARDLKRAPGDAAVALRSADRLARLSFYSEPGRVDPYAHDRAARSLLDELGLA